MEGKGRQEIVVVFLPLYRVDDTNGEYWSIVFSSSIESVRDVYIHSYNCRGFARNVSREISARLQLDRPIVHACPWTEGTEGKLDRVGGSARCEKEEEEEGGSIRVFQRD